MRYLPDQKPGDWLKIVWHETIKADTLEEKLKIIAQEKRQAQYEQTMQKLLKSMRKA